jgi:hypothetical protein
VYVHVSIPAQWEQYPGVAAVPCTPLSGIWAGAFEMSWFAGLLPRLFCLFISFYFDREYPWMAVYGLLRAGHTYRAIHPSQGSHFFIRYFIFHFFTPLSKDEPKDETRLQHQIGTYLSIITCAAKQVVPATTPFCASRSDDYLVLQGEALDF